MLSIRFGKVRQLTGVRIRFRGQTLVLVTKGAVRADAVQARFFGIAEGDRIGWFCNLYLIGRRTVYFGRKRTRSGRRFYHRSFNRADLNTSAR